MPYLLLLIAFGSFIIWNGGVVLGKLISVLSLISTLIWSFGIFLISPQLARHLNSKTIPGTTLLKCVAHIVLRG